MFDDLLEIFVPGGAWLGAGVVLGAAFGKQLRPVAKGAIKYGLEAGERMQALAAEAYERGQDLVAEARHERAEAASPHSEAFSADAAPAEAR